MWKAIEGFKYPYRINENAVVQRQLPNGEWKTMNPYRQGRKRNEGRFVVKMVRDTGKYEIQFLVNLMLYAFMGGRRPPGKRLTHKNGMVSDCALKNLVWTTQSEIGKRYGSAGRKVVEKVDTAGNVVAIYSSISEASRKEHVSIEFIRRRCNGKVKIFRFSSDGYTYRFEKVRGA